jgi:hypothetical protein
LYHEQHKAVEQEHTVFFKQDGLTFIIAISKQIRTASTPGNHFHYLSLIKLVGGYLQEAISPKVVVTRKSILSGIILDGQQVQM